MVVSSATTITENFVKLVWFEQYGRWRLEHTAVRQCHWLHPLPGGDSWTLQFAPGDDEGPARGYVHSKTYGSMWISDLFTASLVKKGDEFFLRERGTIDAIRIVGFAA